VALVALEETEIGAGEKLTSPSEITVNSEKELFVGTLGAGGAATGFGFETGLITGFCRAAGTPFVIGLNKLTDFTGAATGLGVDLATGAFVAGALATGPFTAGAFVVGAFAAGGLVGADTVRVVATDFAQTVTDVGPVLEL
jgi:hypothetical protein